MATEMPLLAPTLTIDLAAVCTNWRHLLAQGPAVGACAAVVKADGYGLGAKQVASALYAAGCRHFFVALVDEALHLRPHLPADAQLFVLHGALPGAEADCATQQLTPVLNSLDQIERWLTQAARSGRRLPAVLQVDTGMARLGLMPAEWERVDAHALQGITPVLLMSHLVSAEDPADPINALQLQRFQAARLRWPGVPSSLANSSGVFLGPDWHFDLLRPGAALYGVTPTLGQANPMRPVLRLQAPLIRWQRVEAGAGVGYNHSWHAPGPRHIATLSVGYADGWLRSLSNRTSVRFQGRTLPLVGRVSMDTITVDVTGIAPDRLHAGAAFDLVDEVHDINALAAEAGTNAYEVLTSLGPRYHRTYLAP